MFDLAIENVSTSLLDISMNESLNNSENIVDIPISAVCASRCPVHARTDQSQRASMLSQAALFSDGYVYLDLFFELHTR